MKNKHAKSRSFIGQQYGNALAILSVDCFILLVSLYVGNLALYLVHGIPVLVYYALMLLPVWCIGALATGQAPGWI